MTTVSLDEVQLDGLREIATIGAGHAATALSTMTRKVIRLRVPNVSIVNGAQLESELAQRKHGFVSVTMGLLGDIAGQTVQIYPLPAVRRLTTLLLGTADEDVNDQLDQLNELQQSTLNEVSNIIVGAYLDAMSRLMPMLMFMSTPQICVDSIAPVVGHLEDNPVFCFKTDLTLGDEHFSADFMFMPSDATVDIMLRALQLA